jgi:hypothetical protein
MGVIRRFDLHERRITVTLHLIAAYYTSLDRRVALRPSARLMKGVDGPDDARP